MPELAKDKALPPLEWLRVFEAAGRLGSFTAAAGELNLTQAAVSQRIRNLERWLGRDLFVRKPRGVDLTLDGEAYLPHVSAALAGLARRTADLFTSARRAISIAAMPSHVELLVLPRLGGFLALHPGLEINFASIFRGRDFDESAAGLHLRYGKGVWVGRTAVLLHQEVLAPVCAPELAGGNWREGPVLELAGPRRGWRDWAAATGSEMPGKARLRFDSFDLLLAAAVEGLGVMLASLPLSEVAVARGQLERLPGPGMETGAGYWLNWQSEARHSTVESDLVEALKRCLA